MVLELQLGWCGVGVERGLFPRLRLLVVSFAIPSKPLLLRMEDYERHLRGAHEALRVMKRQLDRQHTVNDQLQLRLDQFGLKPRGLDGKFLCRRKVATEA